MNILLLEDEADLRAVFHEYFAMEGHQSRGTNNAGEALNWLEQEKFDLLLLDYALPGPTGVQFYLEACNRGFRIPAIFMSGTIDLFAERITDIPGVIACLEKPFPLEVLRSFVDAIESETAG